MSGDEPPEGIFNKDQQQRVAQVLGTMPYAGGLSGIHGIESFEDLMIVLERLSERLTGHAQRDEVRDGVLAKHEAAIRGLRLFVDLIRPEGV